MCLPEISLKKKYKLRKERKKREPDLGVGTHLLRDRGHITPKKKNSRIHGIIQNNIEILHTIVYTIF